MIFLDIIIGSRGFIGREYTSFLSEVNHKYQMVPSSRAFSEFISGRKVVDFNEVSSIIWLAGKAFPDNTPSKSSTLYSLDLHNLELFLNFVAQHNWQGRLIFLSSGGCIYKESLRAIKEDDELSPNNPYGYLKFEQEKMIRESGLRYSILRVSNVFGARFAYSQRKDVISAWISEFRNGAPATVYGSLASFRDFINVRDLVRAIFLSTQKKESNFVLNIGSGSRITTLELVDIFSKCTLGKIQFVFRNSRLFDLHGYYLDISRARTTLEWEPQFSEKINIAEFITQEIKLLT